MNETERQIVAWLRKFADAIEKGAGSDTAWRSVVTGYRVVANAIDLGKHRDKQDG